MREKIYLTQDEIDALVQLPEAKNKADFNSLRALQDGLADYVTYAEKIIYRKKE